jgi:hypothetical protein
MSRGENINERYYARANYPRYAQYKGRVDFTDEAGRIYQVAAEDHASPFANTRFHANDHGAPRHVKVDAFGDVTLYVRLRNKRVPWFTYADRDSQLVLVDRRDASLHPVRLLFFERQEGPRLSATGRVIVSGLDRTFCDDILSA